MKTTFTKTLMAALVSAMTLLSAVGCGEKEPPVISVSGVSINQTNITVKEGESQSLSATVSPSDAQNKAVSWSSSNSSVATVDNSGRVTGVKAGSATITVTTSDGGKTATCSVTVEAKIINVSGVTLDNAKLEIPVGGEATLAATVAPADATDKSITWTSSDEAVAKVSGGKVTAVAAGKATITVKTTDGGKTATCEVTVTTPVASVELSLAETEVKVEGEVTLEATVAPEDATVKDLEWSSSDEAVAKVDATGKVTGVAEGEATITVKTKDGGKTATCKVTVTPKEVPVEEVAFEEATVTVTEGESATVSVSFTPAGATNKAVTYKSSDESVATVDAEGNVSALKPGKATITVTTEDGGKTATCEVTVEKAPVKVTGVTLNYKERTITIGNAGTLIATVQPEDAANKKVTWSSSDESIVKVGQDGAVTPRKEGTATITVTTEDGGFTATCEVTATAKVIAVSGVKLDKTSLTLTTGKTEQLKAIISPSNATNTEVTWTSSKPSVATVDAAGNVKGIAAGSATITVKTYNGKTATCSVKVGQMVESITITNSSGTELVLPRVTWYGGSSASSYQFKAVVTPSNATNTAVTWSSSKTEIATIDQNGKATFKKPGTTTITATAKDGSGVKKSITFIIYEGVANKITLSSSGGTGNFQTRVNGTFTVTANLSVDGRWTPLVNEVTWSLSSTSCARIKSYTATSCVIEGISATTASSPVILTAKAKSGSATVSQQIGILNPPYITAISLPSTLNLTVGQTTQVSPTITPANGLITELSWGNSNQGVALTTLLSSGKLEVKGLKAGPAILTCTHPVTGAKATMTINVTDPYAIQSLDFTNYPVSTVTGTRAVTVSVGSTVTVSARISPSNANTSGMEWKTANDDIATVVSYSGNSCKVKGVKKGNIQLICKDKNSGKSSFLGIIVK